MLNINELEKRWLRYKIKSFIPYISIVTIFIFVILGIFLYPQKKEKIIPIKKEKKVEIIKKEEKIILKPSLDFMKNIKIPKEIKQKTKIIIRKKQQEKSVINIIKKETKNDINIILKRFKKNKNPALSLFLAKKYYEQKNYKQSYKYALITNELNNKIDDSWIIFIKSMIKLGKKEKAIQILKQYIQHSNSTKAKMLLEKREF